MLTLSNDTNSQIVTVLIKVGMLDMFFFFQNHLFKSGVLVVYYTQINIVWFPHLLSLFGREKRKKGSRQKIDINAKMEVWYCLN